MDCSSTPAPPSPGAGPVWPPSSQWSAAVPASNESAAINSTNRRLQTTGFINSFQFVTVAVSLSLYPPTGHRKRTRPGLRHNHTVLVNTRYTPPSEQQTQQHSTMCLVPLSLVSEALGSDASTVQEDYRVGLGGLQAPHTLALAIHLVAPLEQKPLYNTQSAAPGSCGVHNNTQHRYNIFLACACGPAMCCRERPSTLLAGGCAMQHPTLQNARRHGRVVDRGCPQPSALLP